MSIIKEKAEKVVGFLARRWACEGGYRSVLSIAVPLILSTGAWSILHFVDRMFLTWYSPEAIAAAMPAGMLNFTIMSLFLGTAGYVTTFVAQYHGSGQHQRIGPVLWQGIYIAVAGGILHLLLIPLAGPIFRFVGHEPLVQEYEIIYFQVLCLGATPAIASSAISGFFTGRGKAWPVMWVNVLATALNIIMDYALIFGKWGLPELGMKGAAIATVLSACFSFTIYLVLFLRSTHKRPYYTLRGWMFERPLFLRLMYFGFPSGVQFFLEMAGFTAFILLVGRLGTMELAATNIAFNISNLAFMPMIGFGMAVSVLVGQYLGKGKPDFAQRSVYSTFYMTFFYMISVAAAYIFVPNIFINPFASHADPASFAAIRKTTLILLRFVAIYSLFDALNIVFASAIKGAGDTRFVMFMIVVVSSLALVVPSYIALVLLQAGIYTAWTIASIYISILGLVFLFRFLGGKWKSMRVIEQTNNIRE